ncbi:MAG TPA: hypothetical protein PLF78_00400 [Caulobacter sp.]|nr:hypothetical protein [Caulobacter sp.]
MLKALLRRRIAAFEKAWTYNAGYMRELLDKGGAWTLLRFGLVASLGHGKTAPREAIAAAGIVGTLSGDCGPCTQISVDMATAGGVRPEVLRAVLAGDRLAMGDAAGLAWDLARAVLDRNLADADECRDEIARRWGDAAVIDIALALTTAQMYPTVKYALGHGRACTRVVVAGVSAPFSLPEPVSV